MFTTRAWSVAAAVCLVLSVACTNLENPTPSTQSQLVVHAVLNPDAEFQPILVYRARTGSESAIDGGIGDDEPIVGASVTVTTPDGTIMTALDRATDSSFAYPPGDYVLLPIRFGVVLTQGATYSLHVRTPSGDEISGTTTIPQTRLGYTALPPETFHRLQDTLRLSWPSAPGVRSYELVLRTPGAGLYRLFTDVAVEIPGTALTIEGDQIFPPFGVVDVSVSAVDGNYYDYYRAQSDPFAGAAPSHLTGAVGVFGSLVPILTSQLQVR
jgi:hypothetical protein